MYFMNICTWESKDEKEVRKRREKWKWPHGVKVICEFIDLQGCRAFNVIDADTKGLIASRTAWLDILRFETFPVHPFGESKGMLRQ
jgi:hypothetical protein